MSFKPHFSRFLDADPGRLHVAAHSHHPWPDVTYDAHQQAWRDAAELMDDKWDRVLGTVVPEAQAHVARRLRLPDPTTVTFAPNTHQFVVRLRSCLPTPARILTTDAEFHSFARQSLRWEEEGSAEVTRVGAQPFATFPERFAEAALRGGHDLVYFSHVHFDSAYVVPDLAWLVANVADDATFVVVDGYHAFMALPVDLAAVAGRVFYLAGGYKYAMAGEGAVFLHAPPGYGERPPDTGWLAGFGALTETIDRVGYAQDGSRFAGATYDPSGLYRFNAVQRWLDELGVEVADIHARVRGLQRLLLERLQVDDLPVDALLPDATIEERGHFLTFALPNAADVSRRLHARGVVTDHRGDRLRIGFGLYHDAADVDELLRRVPG